VLYRPFGANEDEFLARTVTSFKEDFRSAPEDHEDLVGIKLE
jgi:hypothetical protein